MLKLLHTISLLVLVYVVTGCATVVRGPKQDIAISSNPAGAAVTIDMHPYGYTPTIAKLTRDDFHHITLELEGYEPFFVTLKSERDLAMAGNCCLGGLPGAAVDELSGSAYTLKPDSIHVLFQEDAPATLEAPNIPQRGQKRSPPRSRRTRSSVPTLD